MGLSIGHRIAPTTSNGASGTVIDDRASVADAVIIGSGQGGVPLAVALAKREKRVFLFERAQFGGTCVNNGCTPSKAFLASAHGAGRARRAAKIGVHADVRVDFHAVMQRVNAIIAEWRDGIEPKLRKAGVTIVRAEASFTGERIVSGGGTSVRADIVVIDVGASPSAPPIPGLAETPYVDNTTFFQIRELPRRTIVIGGGYIGLELGQGLARCGSDVHVVHSGTRIMEREEPDASEALAESLREDGIRLTLGAKIERVTYAGGEFTVTLATGEHIQSDALLVATGRTPNTGALDVERSGIVLDSRGFVQTDAFLRTACEGVYAIGEVAAQPAFTHVAWEDHRRILSTLDGTPRRRDDLPLAYATFTEPQIARTGLTVDEARAQGYDALAVTLPGAEVARAIEWNEERGFYRLVIDAGTDRSCSRSRCTFTRRTPKAFRRSRGSSKMKKRRELSEGKSAGDPCPYGTSAPRSFVHLQYVHPCALPARIEDLLIATCR